MEIGYSKVCFFLLFLHFAIYIAHVMTYDKIMLSLILSSSILLYFEMPMRYRIKNCKYFSRKSRKMRRAKKMIYVTDDLRHNFPRSGESVLVSDQRLRCLPTLKITIQRIELYFSSE